MARVARIVIPGEPHHATQRGNNRQDVFFVDDDRRVYLGLLKEESEWRETLVEAEDEEMLSALRATTHTGRPLGSDSFLSKLERVLGRRLRPLPRGRPRKEARKP